MADERNYAIKKKLKMVKLEDYLRNDELLKEINYLARKPLRKPFEMINVLSNIAILKEIEKLNINIESLVEIIEEMNKESKPKRKGK